MTELDDIVEACHKFRRVLDYFEFYAKEECFVEADENFERLKTLYLDYKKKALSYRGK